MEKHDRGVAAVLGRWGTPALITVCVACVLWLAARPSGPLGALIRAEGPTPDAAGAPGHADEQPAPVALQPRVHLPAVISPAQVQQLLDLYRVDNPESLADAVHMLRLYGPD